MADKRRVAIAFDSSVKSNATTMSQAAGGKKMTPTFQSTLWQISVSPPWRAKECKECVEFTQPEGVGALHISGARKTVGPVLDSETLAQLQENSPMHTETEMVRCGDFVGYSGEYVDWSEGVYWKKWFLACRQVLLFISYNCRRGDETVETARASELLLSLRCREQ